MSVHSLITVLAKVLTPTAKMTDGRYCRHVGFLETNLKYTSSKLVNIADRQHMQHIIVIYKSAKHDTIRRAFFLKKRHWNSQETKGQKSVKLCNIILKFKNHSAIPHFPIWPTS